MKKHYYPPTCNIRCIPTVDAIRTSGVPVAETDGFAADQEKWLTFGQ